MANSFPSKSYARIDVKLDLPDLIEVQLESFKRLKSDGLADLFHELSPIESYNKGMKLYLPSRTEESKQWDLTYWFGEPKHTVEECVERDLTYSTPLYVSVLLIGPDVPEPIKQDIFLGGLQYTIGVRIDVRKDEVDVAADRGCDLAGRMTVLAVGLRGHRQHCVDTGQHLAAGRVLDHIDTSDEISVAQTNFPTGRQAEECADAESPASRVKPQAATRSG